MLQQALELPVGLPAEFARQPLDFGCCLRAALAVTLLLASFLVGPQASAHFHLQASKPMLLLRLRAASILQPQKRPLG